jgi:hypothetical protein
MDLPTGTRRHEWHSERSWLNNVSFFIGVPYGNSKKWNDDVRFLDGLAVVCVIGAVVHASWMPRRYPWGHGVQCVLLNLQNVVLRGIMYLLMYICRIIITSVDAVEHQRATLERD